MHTSMEGLYQSCINIGEISNFGFLKFFFSFLLTWGHMGEKFNDILSASAQQICTKDSCILIGRVSTEVV